MEKKKIKNNESVNPLKFTTFFSDVFKQDEIGHLFFLGVLAYPQYKDKKHLIDFVASCTHLKYKTLGDIYCGSVKKAPLDNRTKKYEKRKAVRNINHAFKRIVDRRLLASKIAIDIANKFMSNVQKAVEDLTIFAYDGPRNRNDREPSMQRNDYYYPSATDKPNIFRYIWTESKPVLHMALALQPLVGDFSKPTPNICIDDIMKNKRELAFIDLITASRNIGRKFNIKEMQDLILIPDWIGDTLKISEVYYVLLPKLIPTLQGHQLLKVL